MAAIHGATGAPAAPPPATALTSRERAAAAAGRYTPDRCGGCGAVPDPPLRCAGCRALVYCSPACQKADWREHKERCKSARTSTYGRRMEDPTHEPAWAPVPYDQSTTLLLRLAPGSLSSAQLVPLLSIAIMNLDAAIIEKVFPFATAAGVSPTTVSTVPPMTLLGLAATNCTRRWPPEQLARALDLLRLLVDATPAAALDRARSLSSAPSKYNEPQATLLEFVCVNFNRAVRDDAVAMLLQAGASAHPGSSAGTSAPEPLHYAALYGSATTVCLLLDAGSPPKARSQRTGYLHYTPLHMVAHHECPDAPEKARLLVAAGADVEAVNAEGLTPLAVTANGGSPRVFDALLHLGADIHAVMTESRILTSRDNSLSVRGCALHTAADHNDTAILRRLLAPEHRAAIDLKVRSKQVERSHELMLDGCTPLHFAALKGSVGSASKGWKGALELLLDAGADVHAADTRKGTPLILAINSWQLAAVRLLLRAGAVQSEFELAVARVVASDTLKSVLAIAAAGADLPPELGRSTQQVLDDASSILELLLAARAPDSGSGHVYAPGFA
jgi:ankyrin repeat protein